MDTLFNNIYRFERELGKGGFGRVFLAREEVSHRLVAIKQLNNQDADAQRQIVREIRAVARFNLPNIVTYYHHFSENGLLFLVMEYCPGGSLRDALARKKVTVSEALRWTQTLAEVLETVHKAGVIHHDIKPDNILFSENGTIKVSDFGIANTGGGTLAYMSPEALAWDGKSVSDARVDVYALGVTLMESLTGTNPFFYQSPEQVLALHDKSDFPIKALPHWQQEIILKAINKVPELRFQSTGDFSDAIKAKHVPMIWNKDIIRAGEIAEKVERSLSTKKWIRAGSLLEFAAEKYPENVNVLRALGKYYLMQQKVTKAREQYEKALRLNPRLDVQKDLGWINLALRVYPTAISLLSDHLHRTPSDFEAYNLLLQCFYETDRYEAAMDLAKALLEIDADNPCFANNLYIACVMQNIGEITAPSGVLGELNNEFVKYNFSVISETKPTHDGEKKPTLKSKLLFMDYRFRKMTRNVLYLASGKDNVGKARQTQQLIVTFGRQGYDVNDVQVTAGTSVSRRHCLIVNCKDDVWLYDLESTGTYLNGESVKLKAPIIGLNTLRIGGIEYKVTTDKSELL